MHGGAPQQIASISNSSARIRCTTISAPANINTSRPTRMACEFERHAAGRHNTPSARKKITPSSATGTPNAIDCGLVVTF